MRKSMLVVSIVAAVVVLCMGAVVVEFRISNAYAQKLLTGFLAQDFANVTIRIQGHQSSYDPNERDYSARVDFTTPIRDPNDTDKQYAKKRISLIVDAFNVAHLRKLKNDADREYIADMPVIDVNHPNAIEEDATL